MNVPLNSGLVERYLGLLNVPKREPTLEALSELVGAHATRVPFENVSKLYYRKRLGLTAPPPLLLFLDGMERFHFGGTCYANNFHLFTLLDNLGYDVKFCGADMSQPDVHVVIMASVEKREYLVDVGYGAPFLAPMPRDAVSDLVIELGQERYILHPQDAEGYSRMDLYRKGCLAHGYTAKPGARKLEDFQQAIVDSFAPGSTFMNCIYLARFYPARSVVIHNLTLIDSQGKQCSTHPLAGREELPAAVEKHFDIPRRIVQEVAEDIPSLKDVWD